MADAVQTRSLLPHAEELVYNPAASDMDPGPMKMETRGTVGRVMTGFGRGLARGTLQTASNVLSTLDMPETSKGLDNLAAEYRRDMGSVFDIRGMGDFSTWFAENVAELFPSSAPTLAGAAAGGALGSVAGPFGTAIGAGVGAIAGSYAVNRGDTEKKFTDLEEKTPGLAVTDDEKQREALMVSMIDILPVARMARKFGMAPAALDSIFGEALSKGGILKTVGGQALAEGSTEGLQEFISQVNSNIVLKAQELWPDGNQWMQIADAAASGSAGGAAFGTAERVFGKREPTQPTPGSSTHPLAPPTVIQPQPPGTGPGSPPAAPGTGPGTPPVAGTPPVTNPPQSPPVSPPAGPTSPPVAPPTQPTPPTAPTAPTTPTTPTAPKPPVTAPGPTGTPAADEPIGATATQVQLPGTFVAPSPVAEKKPGILGGIFGGTKAPSAPVDPQTPEQKMAYADTKVSDTKVTSTMRNGAPQIYANPGNAEFATLGSGDAFVAMDYVAGKLAEPGATRNSVVSDITKMSGLALNEQNRLIGFVNLFTDVEGAKTINESTTLYSTLPNLQSTNAKQVLRFFNTSSLAQQVANASSMPLYAYKLKPGQVINFATHGVTYAKAGQLQKVASATPKAVAQATKEINAEIKKQLDAIGARQDRKAIPKSVKTVLASNATRFVHPPPLSWAPGRPVYTNLGRQSTNNVPNGTYVGEDLYKLLTGKSANDPVFKANVDAMFDMVRYLQPKYFPNVKLVLSTTNPNELGLHGSAEAVGTGVYEVKVNVKYINGTWDKQNFMSTLTHELGHMMEGEHFQSAPREMQERLHEAYVKWLNQRDQAGWANFWHDYGGIPSTSFGGASNTTWAGSKNVNLSGVSQQSYRLSYVEWFAQEVAKSFLNDYARTTEGYPASVVRFFKDTSALLTKLFKEVSAILGYEVRPTAATNTFLHMIKMKSAMQNVSHVVVPLQSYKPTGEINPPMMKTLDESSNFDPAPFGVMALLGKDPVPQAIRSPLARFTKMHEYGFSLLQIAQRYPQVVALQKYVNYIQLQYGVKVKMVESATTVLQKWKAGKAQANAVSKMLLDVTTESDRLSRRLTLPEIQAIAQRNGVNGDGMAIYQQVMGSMKTTLDTLQNALAADISRRFGHNPLNEQIELAKLNTTFNKLKARDYFPLSRFGQWAVTAKAKSDLTYEGRQYKTGEVVRFETYETERDQRSRGVELFNSMPQAEFDVSISYLEDSMFAFLGFPKQVLESLKTGLGLNIKQLEELDQIIAHLAPGRSFAKNMIKRRGIAGFSQDAMRSYAKYMMTAAGHIARIQYGSLALDEISNVKTAPGLFDKTTLGQLHEYMLQHYEYFNNPGNELSGLRSAFFIFYLGYSPKAALVNLTQVPMIAYPHFAAKYGDAKAMATLTKAMKDGFTYMRKGTGITPAEAALLQRGVQEGFLDEGLTSNLAALAEGGGLDRLIPGNKTDWVLSQIVNKGAYLFTTAERYNRYVTFLAAIRLNGNNYLEARESVQKTMYELSRWDRPKMMWGKKSVLFMFQSYLQHTLHFLTHDKGAIRALGIMLGIAGLQGLPGAEDLFDSIEAFWSWLGRIFGLTDSRLDIRKETREFLHELGVNPDLAMHGLSRSSFGLRELGLSPGFDVSGSLSMGRIIPGLEPLAKLTEQGGGDIGDALAKSATDVGGPVPSAMVRLLQALASNNPDMMKRFELAMPTVARDITRAYGYLAEGEAKNNLGDTLVEFDPQDSGHMAEIVGQALGFKPTRVSETQEAAFARRDVVEFYQTRRQILLTQYFHARNSQDREAMTDVDKAIGRFNSEAPFAGIRISGEDKKNSFKSRQTNQKLREKGYPEQKRYRQMYQDMQTAYPLGTGAAGR